MTRKTAKIGRLRKVHPCSTLCVMHTYVVRLKMEIQFSVAIWQHPFPTVTMQTGYIAIYSLIHCRYVYVHIGMSLHVTSFSWPFPSLVLQETSAGLRKPRYEASIWPNHPAGQQAYTLLIPGCQPHSQVFGQHFCCLKYKRAGRAQQSRVSGVGVGLERV